MSSENRSTTRFAVTTLALLAAGIVSVVLVPAAFSGQPVGESRVVATAPCAPSEVRGEVLTEQQKYAAGEAITAVVLLTNESMRPCEATSVVELMVTDGDGQPIAGAFTFATCVDSCGLWAPGETVERRITWDGTVVRGEERSLPRTGTYRLVGRASVESESGVYDAPGRDVEIG